LVVEPLPVVSLPVLGFTTNVVNGVAVGGVVPDPPRRVQAVVSIRATNDTAASSTKNERTHQNMAAQFAAARAVTSKGVCGRSQVGRRTARR
jgi:hypothetical protein